MVSPGLQRRGSLALLKQPVVTALLGVRRSRARSLSKFTLTTLKEEEEEEEKEEEEEEEEEKRRRRGGGGKEEEEEEEEEE
ncbi:hypothetical protein Pmani_038342 [Petrolisthes manimaculis]|uniref:Uncharacterized protein n=1 Tax=Petrolisthes manimaculis TaxID=1843537 RepID=A0AAE1NGE5_9EUCA|nr:hypothetical protein Pmani_038342 [Petrolisthes manimaculis]